jgi:hypothetical protein
MVTVACGVGGMIGGWSGHSVDFFSGQSRPGVNLSILRV